MKISIQIAAIRRKIRRLEEHRPLMMERLQTMSESDQEVMVKWLDETLNKAKMSLERMQTELRKMDGLR